ncbi:MAGE family-domain-containing protein [Ampelomyces quisqualis]|uniref:MAGE family-domain-containing protein n=1 Tax=Ampelomyces quisqualis TaxID=50730 RepID=A0A6A5QWB6_AMPQU|nr:MAGE family-domain-containing protein [Ampelomyces quisqualis]
MPPRSGRRRIPAEEDAPTPTQTQRRRRDDTPDEDEDVDMDQEQNTGSGSLEQLSRGLVRYALSCEYARKPLKRQDMNEKVLGSHTRLFKDVLNRANAELMDVFGMQIVELPKAEKVTMRQKRAAAASESQSKSSSLWILQTMLPEQYRMPEVIGPSHTVAEDEISREDSYVGLYTMVIALITISGGIMAEGKLDRALRRMNADSHTPVGTKDKALALMAKDGYITRVKEATHGDETTEYVVGPRGKVEVGREGFAQFARTVYGQAGDDDEFAKSLARTLSVADAFHGGGAGLKRV